MTDIIVSRRSVQLKCLGLYIAAFLMLVMLGQLWITGVRAHNRELALQLEIGQLKRIPRPVNEAEYTAVTIDGHDYYMTVNPTVHSEACQNPVHKDNK
jgi:hypothetical protein